MVRRGGVGATATFLALTTAPTTPIPAATVSQLQLFAGLSRARRVMLGVAARQLSGAEAAALLKTFLAADADFNGTLDYAELAAATKQARFALVAPRTHASWLASAHASCVHVVVLSAAWHFHLAA